MPDPVLELDRASDPEEANAITAALGGLLFGFDTAVISGVTRDLTAEFHLSPELLGLTVASALWGTVESVTLSEREGAVLKEVR